MIGEVVRKEISIERLRQSMTDLAHSALGVLEGIRDVGRFKLSEVTLKVEVSAEGGVDLIGTASVGGSGSITLKFSQSSEQKV